MTEKKKTLDAHRLSFIYEYIFCRCFPHKIIDVDCFLLFCLVFFFVFVFAALVLDSEVEHCLYRSLKLLIILGLLYHFSSRTQRLFMSCQALYEETWAQNDY